MPGLLEDGPTPWHTRAGSKSLDLKHKHLVAHSHWPSPTPRLAHPASSGRKALSHGLWSRSPRATQTHKRRELAHWLVQFLGWQSGPVLLPKGWFLQKRKECSEERSWPETLEIISTYPSSQRQAPSCKVTHRMTLHSILWFSARKINRLVHSTSLHQGPQTLLQRL